MKYVTEKYKYYEAKSRIKKKEFYSDEAIKKAEERIKNWKSKNQ
jgi:hypothetical protein